MTCKEKCWCSKCRKAYDAARFQNNRSLRYKQVKKLRDEKTDWLRTLKENPCTDCLQKFHPVAMQFDHIGSEKSSNVADMVKSGLSKELILKEIAKCELVCANCHAIRTYIRRHYSNIDNNLTHKEQHYMEDNKFLTIKQADNKGSPYFYAERLGIDSIAFILVKLGGDYDADAVIGVVNEFKPPIDKSIITAFGGSLDTPGQTLEQIVIQEVLEESGYKVTEDRVHNLGKVFVSTQMNQYCHLFAVYVYDHDFVGKSLQSGESSEVVWITAEEVFALEDWKAPIILCRLSAEDASKEVVDVSENRLN